MWWSYRSWCWSLDATCYVKEALDAIFSNSIKNGFIKEGFMKLKMDVVTIDVLDSIYTELAKFVKSLNLSFGPSELEDFGW